jgi:TonB family protein
MNSSQGFYLSSTRINLLQYFMGTLMKYFIRCIGAIFLLLLFTAMAVAQENEEIPAAPINRYAPQYPASCYPGDHDETYQEQVIVAAVRTWTYEPRRVNNRREKQEDLEVTFTFKWNGETETKDFDARPLVRVPPAYPERCMRRARNTEVIVLEFDVSEEGYTENVHIIDSSNRCLEKTAIESVKKWRYEPKLVDGKPVKRPGVQTQLTFNLSRDSQSDFRRIVRNKLLRVQNAMKRNKDPEDILKMLQEIEDEFGDSFTRREQGAFHQLRAAIRIEVKDYAGALDDLRMVQRLGASSPEAAEAVAKTIVQLEAIVAAENLPSTDETDANEDVAGPDEAEAEN